MEFLDFIVVGLFACFVAQRAVNKTLKVARTCADLEQREIISKADILKALSFRVKPNQ